MTHQWPTIVRASGRFALVLLPLLAGCTNKAVLEARGAVQDYFAGDPQRAMARLRPLAEKTDENFVLNNVRLGSAALLACDLDEAEAAFLRAYEVINSYGVNNGGRTLGALLVDEKVRVWKGEPFERAMVNFYLGLVYYIRQDYGNARGAFENALFKLREYQDADHDGRPEGEFREVSSNFALAHVMLGRCWQRLGRDDLADAQFELAAQALHDRGHLTDAAAHRESNLLLVVDFGYGPRKVTDFDGSIVGFAPRPAEQGTIPRPIVLVDGLPVQAIEKVNTPPVDLLALAQDRRWQSLDTLRTIKSAVGTGLIAGGAYAGLKRDPEPEAALALMAAGLLLKATSQADIRQWEMLPRTTFLLPLRVEPGRHEVTVEFPHTYGLRQTWRNLPAPASGEATYYLRMQRFNPGPFDWPPDAGDEPAPFTESK